MLIASILTSRDHARVSFYLFPHSRTRQVHEVAERLKTEAECHPRVGHSRLDVRSEFLKQQQPVGDYLIRATMQQTHPYSHNSNVQIPL